MAIRRNKLDVVFSRFVKLLSGGYCKRCHKYFGVNSRGLQTAHFYSRIRKSTRWDIKNVVVLCTKCHYFLDGNPLEKVEFFMKILTKKEFEELQLRANKPSKPDKEALLKEYREKIKLLEVI